ncbi:MAG: hypothetical protein HYZ26_00870 [Chloroflexi bacterium]|nr:hypothetical protein [Chloroflexota bacterium]
MCILIAEIVMFLGGAYALIAGKLKLTKNVSLEGWRARVAGLILLAPLPLALLIGLMLGVLASTGAASADTLTFAPLIEIALVLGALIGAAVFGALAKPKDLPGGGTPLPPAE